MHHPLDVAGGLFVGIAALIVVVFACRAAGAAADGRARAHADEGRSDRALRQDARRRPVELRRVLEAEGVDDPFWCEVPKSRKAPAQVRRALDEGAELVFAWGGDGMVQRCIDVLAGSQTSLAIIPAGTANLFATNLGIPKDIEEAVAIGLHGERRKLDVGRFNGERFAVMAGAGFDAAMIREADGGLKDRFGRVAYVWTGSENLRSKPFRAKIKVDGVGWYKGKASCILLGNVGELFGGVEAFEDARPDDGQLELGVVTADGLLEWGRMLARTAVGSASKSPFAQTTKAQSVKVKLTGRSSTSSTAATASKVKEFKVKVEAGVAHRLRAGGDAHEADSSGARDHGRRGRSGFVHSAPSSTSRARASWREA